MTERATRAFESADGFERRDGEFAVTDATFDASVAVDGDACRVVVSMPTLDAAVADETVPDVVEDGWFETFERRLDGVDGVTRTADVEVLSVDRGDETVVAETRFSAGGDAAEEAQALVNYVEGTWFEGVVPGYEYVEEVAAMREHAQKQGSSGPSSADSTGSDGPSPAGGGPGSSGPGGGR